MVVGPVTVLIRLLLLLAAAAPVAAFHRPAVADAQSTPAPPAACQPLSRPTAPNPPPATPSSPAATIVPPAGEPVEVSIGYVPISIYAPIFVAQEKGYYAEQGLDVSLESFAGGGDLVALTAAGRLDAAIGGAGPAFWNGVAQGLPLRLVAPGHREGSPVVTPLMISTASCESGAIADVADLGGKRVAVNAPGATEYWLAQALGTAGLSIDDVDLQTLAFQDAVVALGAGSLDAAMIAEPYATRAEQEGIAVRLLANFPVQDVQPTAVFANADFAADEPDALAGLVAAYLKACRDLSGAGFADRENLAIVEQYTDVPAALVAQTVPPVYAGDGAIDPAALGKLQTFFRERGQLDYEPDLDPSSVVDRRFLNAALAEIGPASTP